MKSLAIMLFTFFLAATTLAQKLEFNRLSDASTLNTAETKNTTIYKINIALDTFKNNVSLAFKLVDNVTAANNFDYKISPKIDTLRFTKDKTSQDIEISILPDNVSEKREFFQLQFTDTSTKVAHLITVNINEDKADESHDEYPNRLMFLNAAAFDFGSGKSGFANSSYVGHLNVLAPKLYQKDGKDWTIGINAGIMKINYIKNDTQSISPNFKKEFIYQSPFDTAAVGDKYKLQYNKYTQNISNTNWSIYFQPLFSYHYNEESHINLFFHGHAELLVTTWDISNKIITQSEKIDTVTQAMSNNKSMFRYIDALETKQKLTHLSGYFGAGITVLSEPWHDGRFCIQFTCGKTNDNYRIQSLPDGLASTRPAEYSKYGYGKYITPDSEKWNSFFLIRSYYSHKLSKNSNVYIGADVRGFMPIKQSKYALYAGLDISFEALGKLLTDTSK